MKKFLTFCLCAFMLCLNLYGKEKAYDSTIDTFAKGFARELKNKKIGKIAIVNFVESISRQRFPLSDILEEDINTRIIQCGKFDVLVRSRIDAILKELRLAMTGLLDPQNRKEFGKLSNAEVILTGTYRKRKEDILVNTQLIKIETGEAVWAKNFSIPQKHLPLGTFEFPNIYSEPGNDNTLKGALSITSEPSGADIYLDTKRMGMTPAVLQTVAAGKRKLTLVRKGYTEYIENIDIAADETKSINVELKPQYGGIFIETTPDKAVVYIDNEKVGISPVMKELKSGVHDIKIEKENYVNYEEKIEIFYKDTRNINVRLTECPGSLLVISVPEGADVYLDGEFQGVAPCSKEKVPAGICTVEVKKDDYVPYRQKITIKSAQSETVMASLKKADMGTIKVFSIPQGAKIFVNSIEKGFTPLTLNDVPEGEYEVKMSKEGYQDWSGKIEVSQGKTVSVNKQLKPGY